MFSPHWSQPAGNITSSWVLGRCSKKPPAAICCDQSREIAEMVGSTARGPRPALARTLLISPSTYASSSAGVCVGTAVGSGATVAEMPAGVGSVPDEAPAATATTKVGAGLGVGSGIPGRAEFARNTMTMVAAIAAATFSARDMAGLAQVEEVMGEKEPLEDSVAKL
jgi:hypothetical protein